MRIAGCRLASLLGAIGCGLVVAEVVRLTGETPQTALMTAVIVFGCLGIVGGGGLAVLPSRWWRVLGVRVLEFLDRVRRVELPRASLRGRGLVALGLLAYLGLGSHLLHQPDDPSDDDQAAFLQTAVEVQAGGGPLGLLRDLYAGRFSEANRHPLYIGLLSIDPTHDFGRRLSLLCGLFTLSLLTAVTVRQRGWLVGGLFCVLLATNGAFLALSTRAVCDGLMVFWCGLTYLLARSESWTATMTIGGLLGLAYLTKGTGLLLMAGYIGWMLLAALWRCGRRMAAQPECAAGLAGHLARVAVVVTIWLIVASPLLVRNVRRYGSPTYNVNSWLMFVDQYIDPAELAGRTSLGDAARRYLDTHSLPAMLNREVSGLVWETYIVLRMLGPWPLDDGRILAGLPLAACVLVTVLAAARREQTLLLMWLLICLPLFAWYVPIAAGERFPLPLLAPLLLLAAEGMVRLSRSPTPTLAQESRQ